MFTLKRVKKLRDDMWFILRVKESKCQYGMTILPFRHIIFLRGRNNRLRMPPRYGTCSWYKDIFVI